MMTKRVVLGPLLVVVSLSGFSQSHDTDTRGIPTTSANAPLASARTDINHASINELMKVPGLTRGWAERIVRFRPYRSKVDLEEQGVIPEDLYDHIKDSIIAHREKQ